MFAQLYLDVWVAVVGHICCCVASMWLVILASITSIPGNTCCWTRLKCQRQQFVCLIVNITSRLAFFLSIASRKGKVRIALPSQQATVADSRPPGNCSVYMFYYQLLATFIDVNKRLGLICVFLLLKL